jgi:hypothetical protein
MSVAGIQELASRSLASQKSKARNILASHPFAVEGLQRLAGGHLRSRHVADDAAGFEEQEAREPSAIAPTAE